MNSNLRHTGDRQLHKPCHHSDWQMQAPVQSSTDSKGNKAHKDGQMHRENMVLPIHKKIIKQA